MMTTTLMTLMTTTMTSTKSTAGMSKSGVARMFRRREGRLGLVFVHPGMFLGSCISGFLVNIAGSLLTKRTSAMTLKTMTMARNAALVLFSVRA